MSHLFRRPYRYVFLLPIRYRLALSSFPSLPICALLPVSFLVQIRNSPRFGRYALLFLRRYRLLLLSLSNPQSYVPRLLSGVSVQCCISDRYVSGFLLWYRWALLSPAMPQSYVPMQVFLYCLLLYCTAYSGWTYFLRRCRWLPCLWWDCPSHVPVLLCLCVPYGYTSDSYAPYFLLWYRWLLWSPAMLQNHAPVPE